MRRSGQDILAAKWSDLRENRTYNNGKGRIPLLFKFYEHFYFVCSCCDSQSRQASVQDAKVGNLLHSLGVVCVISLFVWIRLRSLFAYCYFLNYTFDLYNISYFLELVGCGKFLQSQNLVGGFRRCCMLQIALMRSTGNNRVWLSKAI